MLILTDGRPSDVDATDERLLLSLDVRLKAGADAYVAEIFACQYTVVERLPGRLPQRFMADEIKVHSRAPSQITAPGRTGVSRGRGRRAVA